MKSLWKKNKKRKKIKAWTSEGSLRGPSKPMFKKNQKG